MLSNVNFLCFLHQIFRLKVIEIYMKDENIEDSEVMKSLIKLRTIQYSYILIYALYFFSILVNSNLLGTEILVTPLYAKIELSVMVLFTVMRLYAHWYLIKMGLNLQEILYDMGHIKSRNRGLIIVIIYIWFISGQLNWLIFRPVLILLLNTTSYECSLPIQLLNAIWFFNSLISWPLAS